MVRHVDAIFGQGAFRPVEPLPLPEGTRVQLRIEEEVNSHASNRAAKIYSPRLANPKDAADFVMTVREVGDAAV